MKLPIEPIPAAQSDVFRLVVGDERVKHVLIALSAALSSPCKLYLVGGYVRRAARIATEGWSEPVGDLDIIVDSPDVLRPDESLLGGQLARNTFGGFRWFADHGFKHVDFWRLAEHYSIRVFDRPATIRWAMQGFPFSIERIAIDPVSKIVLDGGSLAAIRHRVIEYDACDKYMPELQAVRAILLERKTGFRLGDSVVDLVSSRPWRSHLPEMRQYLLADGWSDHSITQLFSEAEAIARRMAA